MMNVACISRSFLNFLSKSAAARSSSIFLPSKLLACRVFAPPTLRLTITSRCYSTTSVLQNNHKSSSANSPPVVANQDIKAAKMRVVYTDPVTNEQKHEILDRDQALQLAKSHELDLILVSPDANPPVCKLGKVSAVVSDLKKKEKEKRQHQKSHSLKEMIMTVGIDKHDFDTKINKVKSFLKDGHPVKVTLFSKRRAFSKAAIAKQGRNTVTTAISDLDDATLHILTSLEDMHVNAPQISDHYSDILCPPGVEGSYITATGQTKVKVHQRREFSISPKSGPKPADGGKK